VKRAFASLRRADAWTKAWSNAALVLSALGAGIARAQTPAPPTPTYVAPDSSASSGLNSSAESIPSPSGQFQPSPPSVLPTNPGPSVFSAGPIIDDGWFTAARRPGLYIDVEALLLHRDSHTIDQPLVYNAYTGNTVMTTHDLGFNQWAPGGRVTLGYRFNNGSAIEGVWFGFQDWNSSASAFNPGSLTAPAGLGYYGYDWYQANGFRASYNSTLQNFEVNRVRPWGRMSLLAGFRYLSWNEYFDLNVTSTVPSYVEHSDYTINTYNNLFGAQIGLRSQGDWNRWNWSFSEKVGLFGNEFWQRTLIQDYGNTYIGEDNWLSHAGVAFVNDFNISLGFRITDRAMLRAGYNLIWIDGLALAPNQLDFNVGANSGTAHNHQGSVFLQGVNAGFQFLW